MVQHAEGMPTSILILRVFLLAAGAEFILGESNFGISRELRAVVRHSSYRVILLAEVVAAIVFAEAVTTVVACKSFA